MVSPPSGGDGRRSEATGRQGEKVDGLSWCFMLHFMQSDATAEDLNQCVSFLADFDIKTLTRTFDL